MSALVMKGASDIGLAADEEHGVILAEWLGVESGIMQGVSPAIDLKQRFEVGPSAPPN